MASHRGASRHVFRALVTSECSPGLAISGAAPTASIRLDLGWDARLGAIAAGAEPCILLEAGVEDCRVHQVSTDAFRRGVHHAVSSSLMFSGSGIVAQDGNAGKITRRSTQLGLDARAKSHVNHISRTLGLNGVRALDRKSAGDGI